MNPAKWLSVSLTSLLLIFPLGALARDHGSPTGVRAVNSRGKTLGATQHEDRHNEEAVYRLIGRRGFSGAQGRTWHGGYASFYPPYFSQGFGWPYGYSGYGTYPYYASQYGYSTYFPYLYFYDLYAQEADRSRQGADEFEALLAREGKLTGPAEVGSFASDSRPLLPRNVALTLDNQPLTMSVSGGPLVLGSGRHTLRIAARKTPPGE
jgi:hypothetical protein